MVKAVVELIKKYVRATNYISAIQIYLQENFLLEKKLSPEHIKPRLLGHWGTCPGINFIYSNLNYLIKKHDLNMIFVLGPGHGFPALQANLFLEGTLEGYYKQATHTKHGIGYLSKNFSWPYGFPSHSNPATPGVILEGGELGYALSTAYGAALDNPNLIVACVIGDGEAETGPTATAWHINKFIDPATNGAVLPILHLNGYKISGPSIFGRMSDKELRNLFYGYGYQPFFVQEPNIYEKMIFTLEKCYKNIKNIQNKARKRKLTSPRFPMIILKTQKGWTGIKELHGNKIEGNCLSHQVVVKNAKSDRQELEALEKWLKSYSFEELFTKKTGFIEELKSIIPRHELRMGSNRNTNQTYKPLKLPDIKHLSEDASKPGTIGSSSMRRAGAYLAEVFKLNRKNFRLMSPDETYSNKLDEVFKSTKRAFVWPIKEWDQDISSDGRVIEMLSEHSLQGISQGYVLTGRHVVFASYESFIEIVSSMANQYGKFLNQARQIPWRNEIPPFNYILTSSGWRQEHNGFSHQNPAFISNMLEKNGEFTKVYFPPDGNSMLVVLKNCLESKNRINIMIAGKTLEPRWLTIEKAEEELKNGLMIWDFASDPNPDVVFVAIGDYLTKETLAAISILKETIPRLRIRFVNVLELSSLGFTEKTQYNFEHYFTAAKPAIFNYHGYPNDIKQFLLYQKNPKRFRVHGYIEHGSTTTPFDMHVRNGTSRYHLVMEVIEILLSEGQIKKQKAMNIINTFKLKLIEHHEYIKKNGVDPPEIEDWKWGD